MTNWISKFKYNPIKPLIESNNKSVIYFTKELLEMPVKDISYIWNLPEVQKILKKQEKNGSWSSRTKKYEEYGIKYPLIETWKHLRFLIQQYNMNKTHSSIEKASEYIFSCQSPEGDIRGILANQYAPYYTGAVMYLLIKAGYDDDPRIKKRI